ncbi:MAG: hypothetical protein RLZZ592_1810 [Pseudomonadota bacterium]|jgi:SET domain-containing protein
MLHPHTTLRLASPAKGLGIFATQPIPKGTVTWVLDPLDQVITAEQAARVRAGLSQTLLAAFDHDYYRLRDGRYILTHDNTRFMNHDCAPNCVHAAADVEIALRDIAAGEELTNDYAGLLDAHEAFACACGAPCCRRWIRPDDVQARPEHWRDAVLSAWSRHLQVEQPLGELLAQSSLGPRRRLRA